MRLPGGRTAALQATRLAEVQHRLPLTSIVSTSQHYYRLLFLSVTGLAASGASLPAQYTMLTAAATKKTLCVLLLQARVHWWRVCWAHQQLRSSWSPR
jgi:hypothetical protein